MSLIRFDTGVLEKLLDNGYQYLIVTAQSLSSKKIGVFPVAGVKHYQLMPYKERPPLLRDDDLSIRIESELCLMLLINKIGIHYWISEKYI